MNLKTNINFLGPARVLTPLSCLLAFGALIAIVTLGFSYGIDFSGGNEIHIRVAQGEVSVGSLRKLLRQAGFKKSLVQEFGSAKDFLIREESLQNEEQNQQRLNQLIESLRLGFEKQDLQILRVDSVGPQIGREMRQNGLLALFYSLLMILIYLGLRFETRYAPSAVFCLFHDAMISMSIFSLFQLEVNVQTLAAILAIVGYSLNDTIVTFDRIRENQKMFGDKKSFQQICSQSLNEVLSRTLLTSLTTLLALSAMYILAGGVIRDFAFTLIIGVIVGTYSSIYVATPLLLFMSQKKWLKPALAKKISHK